ncbi:MAG TPA: hypothetical protein VGK91_03530 [Candidatus Udaeobacter sp.]
MSRTIEAIIAHMAPVKRRSMPAHSKRLTGNWQTGFESGAHVQRKLRLGFTNVAALPATN